MLGIVTKILPNLISPTARGTLQEAVGESIDTYMYMYALYIR